MQRVSLFLFLTFALAIPGFTQVNQEAGQQGRERRGGKFFKKMDKNNDQQISRDEWSRKPKAFDRLDQNHDGVLSTEELKNAPKRRPRS